MIDPNITVESLNAMGKGNMVEYLGIEFTEVNSDSITAKMPVDHRTKQPMGLLHGGASVVLAETIGFAQNDGHKRRRGIDGCVKNPGTVPYQRCRLDFRPHHQARRVAQIQHRQLVIEDELFPV